MFAHLVALATMEKAQMSASPQSQRDSVNAPLVMRSLFSSKLAVVKAAP